LQNLSYDPLTSFEPICYLATSPTAIVVNAASSYRTLPDLLEAARAKPGELTLASIGPGSVTHIGFEMLKRASGTAMTFVPYPGMAPAVNALLGEHVTAAWVDFQVAGEQIRAGKLRPLAAIAQTRIEKLPDVPTVGELGYGDIRADPWFGVVAPARTPKEMLAGLIGRFTAALRDPEVKGKLEALGLHPVGLCGADFGAFMRQLNDDYGRVIREANIKPQ
jgi:tripartite-type tricarboxylate transporter receptor subunit TctC